MIFPSLRSAVNVTIEPLNDFDCSSLVLQQRNSFIASLKCFGSNNSTNSSDTSKLPGNPLPTLLVTDKPSQTLPQGGWIGIGIGIGAFVLGIILAVGWLIRHFNRQLREPRERANTSSAGHDNQEEWLQAGYGINDGLNETDGAGIVREKPDDPLHEMAVPPTEKPDDHIREMETLSAELLGHGYEIPSVLEKDGRDEDIHAEEHKRTQVDFTIRDASSM
jgi:hypothetical protein